MIGGIDVESSIKFISTEDGEARILLMRLWSGGKTCDFVSHIWMRLYLAAWRAGQWRSRCSKSPTTSLHVAARQYPSLLSDQNLHKLSVRYRPLIILIKMIDLFTSWGLLPAACQSGWGQDSACFIGLRYCRDDIVVISAERRPCQYSVIFSFTNFFISPLDRGLSNHESGWGSWYFLQISRICRNHDFWHSVWWRRAYCAWRFRGSIQVQ